MNNLGQGQKQIRDGAKVEDYGCHTSDGSKLTVVERSQPNIHQHACWQSHHFPARICNKFTRSVFFLIGERSLEGKSF